MLELNPGDIFDGRYELIRHIGEGGFSEVWLARRSGLELALKVFTSLDDQAAADAQSEFEKVYNLKHSNLLKPTSSGVYQGRPYLAMPYCANGTTFNLIGKISENELAKLMENIASGLEYLHNLPEPIIHQDIKPENFLIDENGQYLLSDFGMSKKTKRTMIKSISIGRKTQKIQDRENIGGATPSYAPPESYDPRLEKRAPKPQSDIWSFGAALFELASGRLPFDKYGGLIQRKGVALPDFPSGKFSKEFEDLVKLCLQIEPKDRPSASELARQGQIYLQTGKWQLRKLKNSKPKSISIHPEEKKRKSFPIWVPITFGFIVLASLLYFVFFAPKTRSAQDLF